MVEWLRGGTAPEGTTIGCASCRHPKIGVNKGDTTKKTDRSLAGFVQGVPILELRKGQVNIQQGGSADLA